MIKKKLLSMLCAATIVAPTVVPIMTQPTMVMASSVADLKAKIAHEKELIQNYNQKIAEYKAKKKKAKTKSAKNKAQERIDYWTKVKKKHKTKLSNLQNELALAQSNAAASASIEAIKKAKEEAAAKAAQEAAAKAAAKEAQARQNAKVKAASTPLRLKTEAKTSNWKNKRVLAEAASVNLVLQNSVSEDYYYHQEMGTQIQPTLASFNQLRYGDGKTWGLEVAMKGYDAQDGAHRISAGKYSESSFRKLTKNAPNKVVNKFYAMHGEVKTTNLPSPWSGETDSITSSELRNVAQIIFLDKKEGKNKVCACHELGHAMFNMYNALHRSDSRSDRVANAKNAKAYSIYKAEKSKFHFDGMESYAKSDTEEFFACSFSAYCNHKSELKKKMPKTYNYLNNIVNKL